MSFYSKCPRPVNTAADDSAGWCVLSGNCGCDHPFKKDHAKQVARVAEQSSVADVARDAARYRWLRADDTPDGLGVWRCHNYRPVEGDWFTDISLDAAIDAAIDKQRGG